MKRINQEACPVTVHIRSRRTLDSETERLDWQREGSLSRTAEGWLLRYREDTSETCLSLTEGTILMERGGTQKTRMRFQPGVVHPAQYDTPCGALALSVETDYLGCALTERGGQILIRYHLSAQGQDMGYFVLQLQVRRLE